MSLRNILLGLLRSPRSGYDVKKEFDGSLRNFWKAELSQIYPALQKLEREGLLSSEQQDSDVGPKRVVYELTDDGHEELKQWIAAGPVVGTERITFLAQTYFLAELDDPAARIAFMKKLRDYYAGFLAFLKEREQDWASDYSDFPNDLPDDEFYPHLTLDCGIHRVSATLDWCNKTIGRLENRRDHEPSAKSS